MCENWIVKAIRYILTNPLGWAITLIHWLVVAYAFRGDIPIYTYGPGFKAHATTELMSILVSFNMPALVITKLLFIPFGFSMAPYIAILVTLITAQWLLIGAGIQRLYEECRPADDGRLGLS